MEKVKADITDKVGIEHFKAGQNILAAKDDELNDRINHNLEKIINLEESNVIQQQKAKYVDTLNERLTMEIEAKQQSEVWKSSYILRRPQNFAKSLPYF